MAPSPAFLVAFLILVVSVAIAILANPLFAADMRRAVEREEKPPVDMTALALMVLGGLIVVGAPLAGGFLWAVWL